MKKSILVLSLTMLFILSVINMVKAQEQPKPKKDTVNMDTDAKPQVYYAVEDDNAKAKSVSGTGSELTLIIVGGFGLVLVGGAVFFFLKKKK